MIDFDCEFCRFFLGPWIVRVLDWLLTLFWDLTAPSNPHPLGGD